jgi:hypothetical protein
MTYETGETQVPQGEIQVFKEGGQAELFRQPGVRLRFGDLRDRLIGNPVDQDSGAVYVQTVNDHGGRKSYHFDAFHMIDADRPWLVATLDRFPVDDPAHDITVGQAWDSPLGVTERVAGVVVPLNTQAYDPHAEVKPTTSPAFTGRQRLDDALSHLPNFGR